MQSFTGDSQLSASDFINEHDYDQSILNTQYYQISNIGSVWYPRDAKWQLKKWQYMVGIRYVCVKNNQLTFAMISTSHTSHMYMSEWFSTFFIEQRLCHCLQSRATFGQKLSCSRWSSTIMRIIHRWFRSQPLQYTMNHRHSAWIRESSVKKKEWIKHSVFNKLNESKRYVTESVTSHEC